VEKYGTARQATDDNTIWNRKDAIGMLHDQGKKTDTQ
jgi:hypothetical protein